MKREETKKPTRLDSFRAIRADFADFMYSKNEDGTAVVMGRTGASWGTFYVIAEIVDDIALAKKF